MLNDAKLYNARLYNDYIYAMSQHKVWPHPIPDYNKTLEIDKSGMMGYISIPQIQVNNVPIYHGDSDSTLALGVGHLPQSSLPIGGNNTHAVLAAHSGRVNDTLFTELDKLKAGDVFYITTLNLHLKYEVTDEKIVKPNDVGSLNIVNNEDLVTLVTCYPTGINNRRLLVTGKRISLSTVTPSEKVNRTLYGYNFWVLVGSGLLAAWGLASLSLMILAKRRKYYYGGVAELKAPSFEDGRMAGEFGSGVYLTTSKKLAEYYARQDQKRLGAKQAVVSSFRMKKEKKLKYLIYYKKTENWNKFVDANTKGSYEGKAHDFVKGPHSNSPIKVKKRDTQIVLQSEEGLKHLKFVKSRILPDK